jgi:hypothetical protein
MSQPEEKHATMGCALCPLFFRVKYRVIHIVRKFSLLTCGSHIFEKFQSTHEKKNPAHVYGLFCFLHVLHNNNNYYYSAVVGNGAEYTGKVAVADGKDSKY